LRADPSLAQATGAHGIPVLYHAAITNRKQVAKLLLAAGADVNQGAGVTTALHGAAQCNQASMAAWLLEHDADLAARNHAGQTPLEVATTEGHTDVITVLQRYAAGTSD
jgi:ankyrin repeat protein